MAEVQVIPPKAARPDTLRVAAYCRVSSDSTDQLHSYAAQIRAYTQAINAHDGWELVDIYADEGLTGTQMDKREDFNRLMADCRKGKIDKIVVKSISRFARNTRDCLASLRELSSLGVTVKFEKENIDTGTLTSELMVSVSASLAQEESISISKNQRMSYQRRMERGEFITCKAPFGYRLVNRKEMEIIPEEAHYVKWIFNTYLNGASTEWIADQMTKTGLLTSDGGHRWYISTIAYLLTNEKYMGDNETGGVLIGAYDISRKRIYVVSQVRAPEDSISSPTSFIRGCVNLPERLKYIYETTLDNLTYIGEWHSHPSANTQRSKDDVKLHKAIVDYNRENCLPGCMMILGTNRFSIYIDE